MFHLALQRKCSCFDSLHDVFSNDPPLSPQTGLQTRQSNTATYDGQINCPLVKSNVSYAIKNRIVYSLLCLCVSYCQICKTDFESLKKI